MATLLSALSKNLAENVLLLRSRGGFTQAALAKASGLTRSSVTLVESGSANPTLEVLTKLSRALGVSIDELTSPPRAECQFIPAIDVPLGKKSKKGVSLRKLLPDKIRATEIDELILDPGKSMTGSPHVEGTKEYFTCVSGRVTVGVLGQAYELSQGDVLAFPGDKPHSYKNSGRGRARGVSVVIFNPGP